MRMHTFIRIVIASVAFFGLSCQDTVVPADSPKNADAVIPLAIGNQWVTHVYGWDSTGRPQVTIIDTIRIVRDTIIQLERWYVWRAGVCVTNRTSGLWTLDGSIPALFLKYPASLYDTYVYRGDTVLVTSVDTTLTVSGGTFPCVCYRVTYGYADLASQLLFVSPNHGEIRREILAHTSSGREYLASRADLISFQLK